MTVLDLSYDYSSLSLADVLEARDTYHYHLLSKANVVGTAVGRYLIRKDEAWPNKKGEAADPPNKKTYPRTLANSEVRDYSWPCVLAFVRNWAVEADFGPGGQYKPWLIVPKTLYMPDGRAVPVCVVETPEGQRNAEDVALPEGPKPSFMLGGGVPITVNVQHETHVATAGCLVSDGHLTYALTARHACGEAGTEVSSRLRSGPVRVGVSSAKQLTRLPFSKVYPDYPGRRSYVSLDAGLIRLDNVEQWTSNSYGLPPVGALADVHEHSLSLRLIDQPLWGYGAASGLLQGTIKALFYRHRSVGGYDYVGDFLIAPAGASQTKPGDSGMVWHLDVTEDADGKRKPLAARDLRPLAMEWGGQVFDESGVRSTFAVATSLSNVCKLLDVELVTDQTRGVSGYWGRSGHYSIAAFAVDAVTDARLAAFLDKNRALLSFEFSEIAKPGFDKSVGKISGSNAFVPLADVPDEIWKKLPFGDNPRVGGRDTSGSSSQSNGPEHPTHYADIDGVVGPNGETWRELCLQDTSNMAPEKWLEYYETMAKEREAAGDTKKAADYRSSLKQGLLPFRVWQFFVNMVEFVEQGDVVGFLAAAGIVAHYDGDSSQPLHGSIYADGDYTRKVERIHPRTGVTESVSYGAGVHSAYETAMVSLQAPALLKDIAAKMPQGGHGLPLVKTGREAAISIVELMDKAATILKPIDIVTTYEQAGAGTSKATLNALWQEHGAATADVMVLGARYLAMIWESAWVAGNGTAISSGKLKAQAETAVRDRYIDPKFVESLTLDKIGPELK